MSLIGLDVGTTGCTAVVFDRTGRSLRQGTISHRLASRTQMYDLQAGMWACDLLAACGIEVQRLASLAPAGGGVVGTVRPELVEALGWGGAAGQWGTRPGLRVMSSNPIPIASDRLTVQLSEP